MADEVPVDLSADQARELMEIKTQYHATLGEDTPDDRPTWVGHRISKYLEDLARDANHQRHGTPEIPTTRDRRDTVRDVGIALELERPLSVDEIITPVSRIVPVPRYIVEAIRRDLERLQQP
jgi:hypothetical protein